MDSLIELRTDIREDPSGSRGKIKVYDMNL